MPVLVLVLVPVPVPVPVPVLVLDSPTQPSDRVADIIGMLDYENLDVYQCAIEHLACVFKCLPRLPRGHSALTDQWRRAAMSIPLNIGEGSWQDQRCRASALLCDRTR